jgi:pyruvate formate lyase activating enzyme
MATEGNPIRNPQSAIRNGHSDRAVVFNIQRFSIHDGPGIRTTVFFKGCPLRCDWCSNPESQDPIPQLMTRDIQCVACGKCAEVCPEKAIFLNPGGSRQVCWDKCNRCFRCVDACLYGSLTVMGRMAGVDEIIREVERDRLFYQNSGGGVTLSGGEPLSRPQFVLQLLGRLKEKDLHTALDTCGFAPEEVVTAVFPHADLVLYDIKQLNDEKHMNSTGVSNRSILANARLACSRARTWFRVPLIEGYNDDPEDVRALADMAKEMGAEKISFLPYHEGGMTKRRQIGKDPSSPATRPPSEEQIQKLKKIVEDRGVAVSVGS